MSALELDALLLSALLATATVLLSLPLAVWAASTAGRQGGRLRWLFDVAVLLPMALSPAVVGWGVLALLSEASPLGNGLGQTLGWRLRLAPEALLLANTALTLPLMVHTMRPAFEAVDHSLVLTARTLGASRWGAWWSITLAQAAPLLLAACVLGFAAAWGESGAALLLAAGWQDTHAASAPAHGPDSVAPGPLTVPLALAHTATAPHGQAMAARLAGVSVAVALLAMLCSEWARRRWRQRALPRQARGVRA